MSLGVATQAVLAHVLPHAAAIRAATEEFGLRSSLRFYFYLTTTAAMSISSSQLREVATLGSDVDMSIIHARQEGDLLVF
jgi:hypothetical protein